MLYKDYKKENKFEYKVAVLSHLVWEYVNQKASVKKMMMYEDQQAVNKKVNTYFYNLYSFVRDCYHTMNSSSFSVFIENVPKDILKELYKEALLHGENFLARILQMAAEGKIDIVFEEESEREEKEERDFAQYYKELIKRALKDKNSLAELYGFMKASHRTRQVVSYDQLSIELLEKLLELANKKNDPYTAKELEEQINIKKEIKKRTIRNQEDDSEFSI